MESSLSFLYTFVNWSPLSSQAVFFIHFTFQSPLGSELDGVWRRWRWLNMVAGCSKVNLEELRG